MTECYVVCLNDYDLDFPVVAYTSEEEARLDADARGERAWVQKVELNPPSPPKISYSVWYSKIKERWVASPEPLEEPLEELSSFPPNEVAVRHGGDSLRAVCWSVRALSDEEAIAIVFRKEKELK